MREMGTLSGVPIEPPEQTKLLDTCVSGAGVIGGGVPGGLSASPLPSFVVIPLTRARMHSGRLRRDLAARPRPRELSAARAALGARRGRVGGVQGHGRLPAVCVGERGEGRAVGGRGGCGGLEGVG